MQPIQVTMLGPSLTEKGGMGSVETLILQKMPPPVVIRHLSTWDDSTGSASREDRLRVFAEAFFALCEQLWQKEVDLVHLHVAERGSVVRKGLLALLAFSFDTPVILHTHGCEFHLFYEQLPEVGKSLIRWLFGRCSALVALSESWQTFYCEQCGLSPDQVMVLPNPVVIPPSLPPRKHTDVLKMVFLGKINQRKGIFDLLEAFAALRKEEQQQFRLILAGSGEVEAAQTLAESLQIDSYVEFPGWITPEQRNQLLAEADGFLLPSYNEGLPMALLEAMSWGLPVITTPVGGIPEVVTHQETGYLVEPGDIAGLTQALRLLLTQPEVRQQWGEAARSRMVPLDIEQYCLRLRQLYQQVLRRPPSDS